MKRLVLVTNFFITLSSTIYCFADKAESDAVFAPLHQGAVQMESIVRKLEFECSKIFSLDPELERLRVDLIQQFKKMSAEYVHLFQVRADYHARFGNGWEPFNLWLMQEIIDVELQELSVVNDLAQARNYLATMYQRLAFERGLHRIFPKR